MAPFRLVQSGPRFTVRVAGVWVRRVVQHSALAPRNQYRYWWGLPIAEVNMAAAPLYIIVRLWIRRGLAAEFEVYERNMSRIMTRYGGVIEHAIRISASDDQSDAPFEVHVLKFPNRDLYDAYKDDAERHSLSGERAGIITKADILVGTPAPTYDS